MVKWGKGGGEGLVQLASATRSAVYQGGREAVDVPKLKL